MARSFSSTAVRWAAAFVVLLFSLCASAVTQPPAYVFSGPLLPLLLQMPENSWLVANANVYSSVWTPPELEPLAGGAPASPSRIIAAWSGFGWDSNRGDLILFGGGHANYPGNDVYRWRSSSLLWERASLPSEILTDPLLGQIAIDGVDSAPISSHTYDNNLFLPIADRLLTWGGAAYNSGGPFVKPLESDPAHQTRLTGPYLFDPSRADGNKVGGTTGSHVQRVSPHPEVVGGGMWQNRDIHFWLSGRPLPGTHVDGCTGYATENGVDVVYVASANRGSTQLNLYRYQLTSVAQPSADQIAQIGVYAVGITGQTTCAYDPVHKLFVRTGSNATPFQFWDVSLAGPSNVDQSVQVNASIAALQNWMNANGINIQNCALEYDPVRGTFPLWCGAAIVWELTPPSSGNTITGWSIVQRPLPQQPVPPGDIQTGVLGKWRYAPYYDVFVGLQDINDGDVWIYKPSGWVQPVPSGDALPVVSITSPVAHSQLAGQATVTLAADATDSDGTIARVEYYVNNVRVGQAVTPPYTVMFTPSATGSYSAVAIAIDNAGGMSASAPVAFSVGSPSYQGYLDVADCNVIAGWAWDRGQPTTPIEVTIASDGTTIGTVQANVARPDLVGAGIGDGNHGFVFTTPTAIKDGITHTISVQFDRSGTSLSSSPRLIACGTVAPPLGPSNLNAIAISTSQIALSWIDNSNNESGFRIERRTGTIGTYAPIANLAANATSYTDSQLSASTTYYYRVFATNAVDSQVSNEASATTLSQPPSYQGYLDAADCNAIAGWAWDRGQPNTPINVEILSDGAIVAMLLANVSRTDLASAGIGNGVHGFVLVTPSSLKDGATHSISARFAGTSTALSLSPRTIVCGTAGAPAAPSNLVATASSTSQIALSWTDNSNNETGFRIERKTGASGTYATIATVAANTTTYADSQLAASTTYFYRVFATNGADSAASNEASATTLAQPPSYQGYLDAADCNAVAGWAWDRGQPNTPINVDVQSDGTTIATVLASVSRPDLATAGIGNGVHAFNVATPSAVKDGATHSINVRFAGTSTALSSSPKTILCGTVTAPVAPSNLIATATSTSQIALSWSDNSANETSFRVERKTGAAGTYAPVATVGANTTSYTDAQLAPSTTYFYRVFATNGTDSAASNEASATTLALPPSYQGYFDVADCNVLAGWAWDQVRPNTPISVDIYSDGVQIATAVADVSRPDLAAAGFGNGAHGFVLATPNAVKDGASHAIDARFGGTSTRLTASPRSLLCQAANAPAAPSNLAAAENPASTVTLTWNDNSNNEGSFRVERKFGANGTYSAIRTVAANFTSDVDQPVPPSTTIYYRVFATNGLDSAPSNEASLTSLPGSASSYQGYVDAADCNAVSGWGWVPAFGAAAVNVDVYSDGTRIGSTVANLFRADLANAGIGNGAHAYVFAMPSYLRDGTAHSIDVRFGGSSTSLVSSPRSITCAATVAPAAPSNLTAVQTSSTQITLTWTDNSNNEGSFRVERKVGASGTYAALATLPANTTTTIDNAFPPSTTVYYHVLASNGLDSAPSNEVSLTTPASTTLANYQGEHEAADCTAITGWAWYSSFPNTPINVDIYADGTQIATVFANVSRPDLVTRNIGDGIHGFTFATPASLKDGVNHSIQVRFGGTSTALSLSPRTINCAGATAPAAPTNLTAVQTSSTQITLTWTDNSNNEGSFRVERKVGASGTYAALATLPANTTTTIDNAFPPSTTVYYHVLASNGLDSAPSNEVSLTTPASTTLANYQGEHEAADCTAITGWAWYSSFPNTPINVDIYADGTQIATVFANVNRPDLVTRNIGDGIHGFTLSTPASLKDGATHAVQARFGSTAVALASSPRSVTCSAAPGGGGG